MLLYSQHKAVPGLSLLAANKTSSQMFLFFVEGRTLFFIVACFVFFFFSISASLKMFQLCPFGITHPPNTVIVGSNCIILREREREKWQPDSDGLAKNEKSNLQEGLGDGSDLLHCDWVKGQPECTTPLLTV